MPIATGEDDSGIVSPSPTGFAPQVIPQVNIVDNAYKDIAVDTKWTPISSLMTMVEGSNWTVEYYSQIIDTDTPLTSQAVTLSAPYQQYRRIRDLTLKVTTPLQSVQDDVTKMMTVDGAAMIFAGLIPNEGDAFIADIGVGKPAVFRVKSTQKRSYFKEAIYNIEYAIVGTDAEYLDDLANKVVQELVFRRDFVLYGQNPVIEAAAEVTIDELEETATRLTKQYFDMFFEPEFQTIIIPQQATSVYDPFLTEYLTRVFTREDSPMVQHVRLPNVQDDVSMKQDNLWTALLNRDPTYLKTGFTQTGLVYCNQFSSNPFGQGIRWTNIGACVYPANPKIGLYGLQPGMVKSLIGDPLVSPSVYNYMSPWLGDEYYIPVPAVSPPQPDQPADLVDSTGSVNVMYAPENLEALQEGVVVGQPIPILPVTYDAYYVLSANFYNHTQTQSILEAAVWTYLNGEALDPQQLSLTASLYYEWGVLEKFYYIPILITLMRAYVRSYQEV
jgi:hypothetical protein